MSVPVFPSLVGQGWSVHKKPRFDTRLAEHASGREARASKYEHPLFDFELTFDGLDATSAGTYGALGPQSFQTLAGFFDQVLGRATPFLYVDPTDNAVVGQLIAIGDGSTKAFTFIRPIGGYTFPVDVVTKVTALYLDSVVTTAWNMTGANVVTFDVAPRAGAFIRADFAYAYAVRFSDDVEDFEEFMALLMACKTVQLQSVRDLMPVVARHRVVIFLFDTTLTQFVVPHDFNPHDNLIEAWGAGGGGDIGGGWLAGGGGGGGAYGFYPNCPLTPGQVVPVTIGKGGGPGTGTGAPGGATSFNNQQVFGSGGGYLWFGYYGGQNHFPSGYGGGSGGWTFGAYAQRMGNGGRGGGSAGGPGGQGGPGGDIYPGVQSGTVGAGGGGASGGGAGASLFPPDPPPPGQGGAAGPFGAGKGGDGGASGFPGVNGQDGSERTSSAGQIGGSGAGGGGGGLGQDGGRGGKWGGGGGGGGPGGQGGRGADGAIVITYTVG